MSELHGKTVTDKMRDTWHQERAGRIGASEIASAIGINQYDSQLRLYLTKAGKLPPKEANEAMEIGTALEPAILNLYERRTGKAIMRNQVFYVAPKHDFLCATLDGITDDGINVQAKNVGCQSVQFWGPDGSDEIPHHVLLQVNQEMLCSGLNQTHVVALIGGSELRIYPVARDEQVIKHIVKLGGEFIQRVRTNTYPEPDKDRDQDLIRYLFTDCIGIVDFDEAQSADVIKWERLGEELKQVEIEHKQLKMHLLMALGDASQANLMDGRTLYRSVVSVPASTRAVKSYSFPRLSVKEAK